MRGAVNGGVGSVRPTHSQCEIRIPRLGRAKRDPGQWPHLPRRPRTPVHLERLPQGRYVTFASIGLCRICQRRASRQLAPRRTTRGVHRRRVRLRARSGTRLEEVRNDAPSRSRSRSVVIAVRATALFGMSRVLASGPAVTLTEPGTLGRFSAAVALSGNIVVGFSSLGSGRPLGPHAGLRLRTRRRLARCVDLATPTEATAGPKRWARAWSAGRTTSGAARLRL